MMKQSAYRWLLIALAAVASPALADEDMAHGSRWYTYWAADRLEYRDEPGGVLWDVEGWAGGDYRKLWWKSEGTREDGTTEAAEVQLLYSRAVTPWFDLQLGVRHDFLPGSSRTFAVAGLQGLLPYWFEVDAAAFLSDDGDLSARIEAEYDLLITQRLILQPRIELRFAGQDVADLGIGSGLSTSGLGLRLRYEIHRKFAPYAGVAWQKSWAGTADFKRARGKDASEVTLVAGLRFWF